MSAPDRKFEYRDTTYGFVYGPAEVERAASDSKAGVVLMIKTKKESLMVRVTPSGLIRVYDKE